MSAELMQQLTDKQLQLILLLQQWWKDMCGDKAVSGLLCPLCKDQPHPLDYPLDDQLCQVKGLTPSMNSTEDSSNEQQPQLLNNQPHTLGELSHSLDGQPCPLDDQPHPRCNGQLVKLSEHSIMLIRLGEYRFNGGYLHITSSHQ